MSEYDRPLGIVAVENVDEVRGKLKAKFEAAIDLLADIEESLPDAGYDEDLLNRRFYDLVRLVDQTGQAILSGPAIQPKTRRFRHSR